VADREHCITRDGRIYAADGTLLGQPTHTLYG